MRSHKPAARGVKIYEHWEAGGVIGHGWDVFFGDGTHRAFDEEQSAWAAASEWARNHHVSVWLTTTKGRDWRLVSRS